MGGLDPPTQRPRVGAANDPPLADARELGGRVKPCHGVWGGTQPYVSAAWAKLARPKALAMKIRIPAVAAASRIQAVMSASILEGKYMFLFCSVKNKTDTLHFPYPATRGMVGARAGH